MHKNFIHPNCLTAAKGDCGRVRRGRSPLAHFDIRSRSGNRYIVLMTGTSIARPESHLKAFRGLMQASETSTADKNSTVHKMF